MTKSTVRKFRAPPEATSSIFKKPSETELAVIASTVAQHIEPQKNPIVNLEPAQVGRSTVVHRIGETKEIPLNLIKLNKYNARQVVSSSSLEELATSISMRQDVAVLVYTDAEGQICLIDGSRRIRAARLAGKETIRAEFVDPPESDKALYQKSRRVNKERDDHSFLDEAFSAKLLLEDGVYASQIELATANGVEETVFSRIYALTVFTPHLTRLLSERPKLLNLRMLTAIRQYFETCGEAETEELLTEIEKSDLSSRQVDAKRIAQQTGKKSRARGTTIPIKFQHGNATVKRFDDKGKLVLEISSLVDPAKMALLDKRLNETMTEVLGDPFQ